MAPHPASADTEHSPPRATTRDAPLHMEADEFRRAGHALVDAIAEFLEQVPERGVTAGDAPAEIERLIDATASLPDHGMDADTLLRSAAAMLFDHSLLNGHPRFFGYITSSPAPIGMLGDLLAAAVNANVGSWRLGPVATEIEAQTVRWIAELIGFPAGGGGLLVSGGNMANTVPLLAARAAAAQWAIRKQGVAHSDAKPLRVYASEETHTWIQKATDMAGLGTDAVRWIPTDAELRMDTRALRDAIEKDQRAGAQPMMVVGTAGSVSTGAVDPLFDIARICSDARVWFHVDGAYGALAARVPGSPPDLAGLSLADSVAVDPHKWLYSPLEAGCVIVRDRERLRNAFSYHPPYYHFGQEATNFVDFGPQNSRGFRALKVWLGLRHVGRTGYMTLLGDDIRLSERLARLVGEHPELELLTQSLSITTFRYVPLELRPKVADTETDAYIGRLNEALLERIQQSGELFVSNAVIRGRYALRACIVNFNTTTADIDAVPDIVTRLGGEIHATMRATAGSTER